MLNIAKLGVSTDYFQNVHYYSFQNEITRRFASASIIDDVSTNGNQYVENKDEISHFNPLEVKTIRNKHKYVGMSLPKIFKFKYSNIHRHYRPHWSTMVLSLRSSV